MNHAIMNARAIITPSRATKKDILHFYTKCDEQKIEVIYEGVSDLKSQFLSTNFQSNHNYQLPIANYLLYVGSFYPHKNIENLIKAFTILREKYKLDINLVLAGKKDYFYQQLRKLIDHNEAMKQLNHTIHFVGYIDDDTLANLYQNAALFIFPSLCEGFGLPPLEAMQFGIPTVASNVSSIPEICGDAALYCNPQNVEDIALKIYTALTDAPIRNKLRENGFRRIQMFSWRNMGEKTLQVYENMLKGTPTTSKG